MCKPLCDPFATAVTKLNIDEYISQLKKNHQACCTFWKKDARYLQNVTIQSLESAFT